MSRRSPGPASRSGAASHQIFLLSPANCSGQRARMLMSERATFDLADRLRSPHGAPLGEVFSFMSGLYFRGKLTYAMRFASSPDQSCPGLRSGVFVITPAAGLLPPEIHVTPEVIEVFAAVDVRADNPRYREPLESSAHQVAARAGPSCRIVLLGSIASSKYIEVLMRVFGDRLYFPVDFVGRGDMSRGGLMLRAVAADRELEYVPVEGALRHGQRPPKLEPLRRGAQSAR